MEKEGGGEGCVEKEGEGGGVEGGVEGRGGVWKRREGEGVCGKGGKGRGVWRRRRGDGEGVRRRREEGGLEKEESC